MPSGSRQVSLRRREATLSWRCSVRQPVPCVADVSRWDVSRCDVSRCDHGDRREGLARSERRDGECSDRRDGLLHGLLFRMLRGA